MLDLKQIPFFAVLSADELDAVRGLAEVHSFGPGAVILRRGEPGEAFYAIASGGVSVDVSDSRGTEERKFLLGPGEVFGEMSLVTGMPVVATVSAVEETSTYRLPKEAFLGVLESHPSLRASLMEILIRRMRHQTRARFRAPACVVLELSSDSPELRELARVIERGVCHYAPASSLGGTTVEDAASGTGAWETRIDTWRGTSAHEQFLVLLAGAPDHSRIRRHLRRGDVALRLRESSDPDGSRPANRERGLFDEGDVVLQTTDNEHRPADDRWCFRVGREEVREASAGDWHRDRYREVDRVVRWLTRRAVGVALGAGAARGFAHFGVLAVLEEAGVPLDYVCGSSIGGIVALMYAKSGSAPQAIEDARRYLAGNRKLRQFRWFPRSSLLSGARIEESARAFAGDMTFAELARPAAAVASDLAKGQRVVLDRGSVADAVVATSAIPGLLPPVVHNDNLLVDGALVSRIPADLLDRRRCGLKIAVSLVPSPGREKDAESPAVGDLAQRVERFLGLGEVLARSWELLSWWQGAAEAEGVDVLIEPMMSLHSGYDFDAIDQMIEVGRRTTEEKLPMLEEAFSTMLTAAPPLKDG